MIDNQPDSSRLLSRIGLKRPLIGFYDAPQPEPFQPLLEPEPGDCIFSSYQKWQQGQTLHLTPQLYGCGGAGRWIWGLKTGSRQDFIKFLVDEEGLKASPQLMEKWIDSSKPYQPDYKHIFIGPLKQDQWPYLKSVTFYVNPDQLSTLMIGVQYYSLADDPPPVIAPFGSGCRELLPFEDLNVPQAAIGATDIAMRQYLAQDILAFTVTKSMFKRLCDLDERSFLYKGFLKRLNKARGIVIE